MLLSRKFSLILALSITTLFFALVLGFYSVSFETNDDVFLLQIVAGYITGVPTAFEMGWMTIGFTFVVSRLYMIAPMIPWYTAAQLFILWFSYSVICFCILDSGRGGKKSLVMSVIVTVFFLAGIMIYSITMLQYTVTAGAAIGAAIALLVHYKESHSKYFIFTMATLILLFVFSYSLRPESFIIGLSIFICVALISIFRANFNRSQMTRLVVIPLSIVAILYIVNWVAYNTNPDYENLTELGRERRNFMDYPRPSFDEAPWIYENAGLDRYESGLINIWTLFLDKVDIQMFRTLSQGVREFYENTNNDVMRRSAWEFIRDNTQIIRSSRYHMVGFLLIALCSSFVISSHKLPVLEDDSRNRIHVFILRNSDKLIAFGIFSFFILTNIYFHSIERFPSWVYRMLLMISIPPVLVLSLNATHTEKAKILNIARAGICILCFLSFLSTTPEPFNARFYQRRLEHEVKFDVGAQYVIDRPDNVFFRIVLDWLNINPFKTFLHEKPTNMITAFGSGVNYPFILDQLELNGFPREIDIELLLDERSYIMFDGKFYFTVLSAYFAAHYPEYELVEVDYVRGIGIYKFRLISN